MFGIGSIILIIETHTNKGKTEMKVYTASIAAKRATKEGKFSSPLVEKLAKGAIQYSGLETCEMTLKYCHTEFKSMRSVRKVIQELLTLGVLKKKRVTPTGYVIYEFV